MKFNVYAILDEIAEEFSSPFLAKTDGVARRQYREMLQSVAKVDSNCYKLFMIAEYDTDTAYLHVIPKTEIKYDVAEKELGL